MPRRLLPALLIAALAVLVAAAPSQAQRKASHAGWPKIDGLLLINKFDQTRPLDARGGHDPFDGADPTYRCDGDHVYQGCFIRAGACPPNPPQTARCKSRPVMPSHSRKHNELLGGHGNDRIHGGPRSDVIWGDYKPDQWSGPPLTQLDHLYGGGGSDFIYASHGDNVIHTGRGRHDIVHARYGHGEIYCGNRHAIVNLSHRSKPRYRLHGCHHITLEPVGTQEA